ncbi:MAG TPA: glycosyltransferase family 4 protein [Vicinamibacterales bacterium]
MTERRIRVLAISPIPEEGAGCRFRIAQFMPYLNAHGFDVTLSALYTTEFFRQVYKPGNLLRKAAGFAALSLKQLSKLSDGRTYDVVFLYREILPIGPAVMEWLLTLPGNPPIVFDFDDAIFLRNTSDANQLIAALKVPSKVATIVRRSAHVIAGNDYLADYARRFNPAVTTIPTCVDTSVFRPRDGAAGARDPRGPVIGWIGSPTTADYIKGLGGVLREVAARHPFVLRVSGTGQPLELPGVHVENATWALADEIELFRNLDIGVYPLVDDEWARGKCGFKAIEFMACGVPVVAAAVGVNREIIQDGVNGFLASTPDEWVSKLGLLIGDPALRAKFAAAGRATIESRYSLHVNAPRVAEVLRQAAAGSKKA